MIVTTQHLGNYFIPISYNGQRYKTYLSKQIKSAFEVDSAESFEVQFDSHFELEIPRRTRIPKEIKKRFKMIKNTSNKGHIMIIPSISIKFIFNDVDLLDPHTVLWKDVLKVPRRLEVKMLNFLEKIAVK